MKHLISLPVGNVGPCAGPRLSPKSASTICGDASLTHYWGHSGSPLFNEHGEIVAMHNSWDDRTAMRHAVTHEALAEFLRQHRADLATD